MENLRRRNNILILLHSLQASKRDTQWSNINFHSLLINLLQNSMCFVFPFFTADSQKSLNLVGHQVLESSKGALVSESRDSASFLTCTNKE